MPARFLISTATNRLPGGNAEKEKHMMRPKKEEGHKIFFRERTGSRELARDPS